MNVSETKSDGKNGSVGTEITLLKPSPTSNRAAGTETLTECNLEHMICNWLTFYTRCLDANSLDKSNVGQQKVQLPWRNHRPHDCATEGGQKSTPPKKRDLDRFSYSAGDRFIRRREKPRSYSYYSETTSKKNKRLKNSRKHPVQLLCELYGKNGLQTECEFLCDTPFRRQKVTYTVLGQKFTAISHTRDEAKRLCAKQALTALHPELHDQLQEQIPRQEYDFGCRLNSRHPVDLVSYFARNEHVMMETEKKGLSHFTTYTVTYVIRGRKYVATAEKQNEAKRRCAIMVLNDIYKNANFFNTRPYATHPKEKIVEKSL